MLFDFKLIFFAQSCLRRERKTISDYDVATLHLLNFVYFILPISPKIFKKKIVEFMTQFYI